MEHQNTLIDESTSALERFRQQWREEVHAKSKQTGKKSDTAVQGASQRRESISKPERPIHKPPTRHPLADDKDDGSHDEASAPRSELIEKIEGLTVREVDEDDFTAVGSKIEPKTALEHYERAVEKESQGKLGDSLQHYRKAYRLDDQVDKDYKKKHFPSKPKVVDVNPSNSAPTVSNSVNHPLKESDAPVPFLDVVASYASLPIPNAAPMIEGETPPPCPIRRLPTEVLLELLQQVAIRDPSVFVRLALVCKRFAYHVFMDSSIWKRVALGAEFGLASQQYRFATDVHGREAIYQTLEDDSEDTETALVSVTEALFPKDTNWREVFHTHPRVRFSGVYISTVNYTRQGGASATLGNWVSNVHIVTYYRYLRFFRDGTVISLLTVNEPIDVVHHLTKENMNLVRGGKDSAHPLNFTSSAATFAPIPKEGQSIPPSAQNLMKHALRGRWRLCHPSLTNSSAGSEVGANMGVAGDLHIETEGAGPRYLYTLHLSLKSGSRAKHAAKNNKLVWKGFWSYNQLTDDWSEFTLRNDKAFYFSRVKRYGLGY